jgi:hypothetical protein
MSAQSKARDSSARTLDSGFESRSGHECLPSDSVSRCPGSVDALRRLIAHPGSPTVCRETDRERIKVEENCKNTGRYLQKEIDDRKSQKRTTVYITLIFMSFTTAINPSRNNIRFCVLETVRQEGNLTSEY